MSDRVLVRATGELCCDRGFLSRQERVDYMSQHGPLCRDMGSGLLEAARSRQRFHISTGLTAR